MVFLRRRPQDACLKSCLCTAETLMAPDFQNWAERLGEARNHMHRKVWEWAYICQALFERGMLQPGKRGLGFAVGQEPLTALFAQLGAGVLATDLNADAASAKGWIETSQHANGFAALNRRGICDGAAFRERVEFRFADMNNIGPELHGGFDFLWSSCAFEHLGSLENGARFVLNAMACLKPGGVAVHTTEFNVSSNRETVNEGDTVLYRRRDISDLVKRLRRAGHEIKVNFDAGKGDADQTIDVPPYKHDVHLKVQIQQHVVTSIGLIATKGGRAEGVRRHESFLGRLKNLIRPE